MNLTALIARVANETGLDATTDATVITAWINQAYQQLSGAFEWPWLLTNSTMQTEADIIAKTTDRLLVRSSRMLFVHQLGKSWEVPDRAVLACERVLPTFGDIGDGLALDADRDLKWFRLLPMNDQWIGAPISRRVELARLDAGNMHARRQDLAVEQRRNRVGGTNHHIGRVDRFLCSAAFD